MTDDPMLDELEALRIMARMGCDDEPTEIEMDPMLAKAEAMEKELLKRSLRSHDPGPEFLAHDDSLLLDRAALLIQQLRIRLQGENSTDRGGVGG